MDQCNDTSELDANDSANDRDRIAELEARIAELSAVVARLDADATGRGPAAADETSSRRALLRNAALAATGAVAAAVWLDATPAAALDYPQLQNTVQLTGTPMQVTSKVTNVGAATFAFASGVSLAGAAASPSYPCALGGWSVEPAQPTGVYGYSAVSGGNGVVGQTDGPGATVGVFGTALNGTGVFGDGAVGMSASGTRYGFEMAKADGAAIRLSSTGRLGAARLAPRLRSDAHQVGEIDVDIAGDLWYCAVAGTPGTWRKLAGTTTAGAFHPVVPARLYDSRTPAPGPVAALFTGQTRLVNVAARRDTATGAGVENNYVPAGATAIACNVTVVDTIGAGFLTINPGGITAIGAATVNWSASGQILNNGVTLTLNAQREVTVVAGGDPTAGTHVVLDVTGYYL